MSDHTSFDFFSILRSLTQLKMFNFMVSILLLLILQAVLEGTKYSYLVHNFLSTVVIIFAVYAIGTSKIRLIIIILLAIS